MKVYTLGRYGLVSREVITAIGDQPWHQQADVWIVERSKADAIRVAADRRIHVSPHSEDFRVSSGNAVDALRDAGLCDEPGVLVTSMNVGGSKPVVRLAIGGAPEVIGTLVSNYPNGYGYTFTPNS